MYDFDPYDALVPVFVETHVPKRVRQIGSAIFTRIYGTPFLLTAAHITDELSTGTLLVPTLHGLSPIEGYVAYVDLPPEVHRREDTIDIAYYRLSTQFSEELSHHFHPLPQPRTEIIKNSTELGVCSVSGYPASKGKKDRNVFSSEIYSFRGVAAAQAIYDELGLSPDNNIIIHFHKKRAVVRETGERFPTPSLSGISGGGIFAWPRGKELSEDWSLPRLVGIVHTYKERDGLIIGSPLISVLAAIGLGRMNGFGGMS